MAIKNRDVEKIILEVGITTALALFALTSSIVVGASESAKYVVFKELIDNYRSDLG
jgi:fucose permease